MLGDALRGAKVIVSFEVPDDEGASRPLRFTTPEGSILNCGHRAPGAAHDIIRHLLPHATAGVLGELLVNGQCPAIGSRCLQPCAVRLVMLPAWSRLPS